MFLQFFFCPLHASHSAALLPPLPSQPPHPEFWKAHLQYLCSLWDGPSVSSHGFICKSCVRVRVCSRMYVCVFSFLSLSLRESCGCVFVLGFLKVVSGSGFGEKACEGSRDAGGMGAAVTTPLSLGPSPPVLPPQSRPPNLKALNIVCWGVGYEFGRQCHSTVDGG